MSIWLGDYNTFRSIEFATVYGKMNGKKKRLLTGGLATTKTEGDFEIIPKTKIRTVFIAM